MLRTLLGVLAFGILAAAAPRPAAADKSEIYPLSKVKKGLKGYAMATFQGSKPERVEFEVVGIMKNFRPKLDIILIKSEDPKLENSKIWHGMSGSPIYFDDKMACAVSYGWSFQTTTLGGCTPIESMIDEGLNSPVRSDDPTVVPKAGTKKKDKKKNKKAKATASYGTLPTQVATASDWATLSPDGTVEGAMRSVGAPREDWLLATPRPPAPEVATPTADGMAMAAVPLAMAGFSTGTYTKLEQLFDGFGLDPMNSGGTGGSDPDGPTAFEPGGPIAVELMRGDMAIAGYGTVTYVEGSKLLAFGHPMFQTGETYCPVATSDVLSVVASSESSFVLGRAINEAGSLVLDGLSMIRADTSLRQPMIPVDVYLTTHDGKTDVKDEFHVEIWNNKFWTAALANAAVGNAVDVYMPDRADVTAKVESTLKVKGFDALHFVDYLYANDGAGSVAGGARGLRAIIPILWNPWVPAEIEKVEVKIDLSFATDYGDIVELRVPAGDLKPGSTVNLEVVLESWNKKDIVDQVPVEIPASLAGQIVTLEVVSGDMARLDVAPPTDLKSLMKAIRKLLPGDTYAVTIYAADEGEAVEGVAVRDLPNSAHDKLHPQTSTQRAESYRPLFRTTSPATRVINGSASATVRIADIER